MSQIVYIGAFFVLGAIVGSFLNVCAYRIPRKESVAFPPSHCTKCGSTIRHIDNIPVLSYVFLAGKCRQCKESIGARYPIIELITGVLWLAAFMHFGMSLKFAVALFFTTVVILLSAIDIDTKLIPNKIIIPAIAVSVVFISLFAIRINLVPILNNSNTIWSLYGFLVGGGLLYVIALAAEWFFKKSAMGGGDIKLAAFAGIYLGGYVLEALFISFIIGAVIGIALVILRKADRKDLIPFGPFIAAGSLLAMFYGPQIWDTYLKLAGIR